MTHDRKLSVDDLRMLGSFYSNGFALVIEDDGSNVRLVPPRSTWQPLLVMAVVISVFYAIFLYFAFTYDLGAELGVMRWAIFIAIGLLAIVGPVVGHILHLRFLERHSPQLDFDRSNKTLALLAGSKTFDFESIHCLLGLSMRDSHGDANSELQVVVRESNGLRPILIATDLSSFVRRSFGETLIQFQILTGIQAVIAEPDGLLKSGKMKIEYLEKDE